MTPLKMIIPGAAAMLLAGAVFAQEDEAASDGTSHVDAYNQDAAACQMWAYENVGAPPAGEAPEAKEGSVVKGTAIGAGTGAAVGAIGGEVTADKAGKGAAVGAIIGGAAGFLKSRKNKKEKEKEAVAMDEQQETFDDAVATCMRAKGYQ